MGRRYRAALLALAAALVAAYAGVSWYMASSVTRAERAPLEAGPASVGLAPVDVTFPSRDGSVALRGWYVPLVEPKGTVVVVHGLDSNRASPSVGLLEIAAGLVDAGFSVLLFDLRGHGESGEGQLSGGYFEQQDLLGAVDFLAGAGVPAGSIGFLGVSLGAAVAVMAAVGEPGVRAVVADSPFADIGDLVVQEARERSPLPGWAVPALVPGMKAAARLAYGIRLGSVAPERSARWLPYPLLLIHGSADTRIPPAHSLRIGAASPNPGTEVWLVPGAEHARAFKTAPDQYLERVAAYFARGLGPASVAPVP